MPLRSHLAPALFLLPCPWGLGLGALARGPEVRPKDGKDIWAGREGLEALTEYGEGGPQFVGGHPWGLGGGGIQ